MLKNHNRKTNVMKIQMVSYFW